jgi:hypothetical protein
MRPLELSRCERPFNLSLTWLLLASHMYIYSIVVRSGKKIFRAQAWEEWQGGHKLVELLTWISPFQYFRQWSTFLKTYSVDKHLHDGTETCYFKCFIVYKYDTHYWRDRSTISMWYHTMSCTKSWRKNSTSEHTNAKLNYLFMNCLKLYTMRCMCNVYKHEDTFPNIIVMSMNTIIDMLITSGA